MGENSGNGDNVEGTTLLAHMAAEDKCEGSSLVAHVVTNFPEDGNKSAENNDDTNTSRKGSFMQEHDTMDTSEDNDEDERDDRKWSFGDENNVEKDIEVTNTSRKGSFIDAKTDQS